MGRRTRPRLSFALNVAGLILCILGLVLLGGCTRVHVKRINADEYEMTAQTTLAGDRALEGLAVRRDADSISVELASYESQVKGIEEVIEALEPIIADAIRAAIEAYQPAP